MRKNGVADGGLRSLLRELDRAEAEFRFASPGNGEVDAACYHLLEAETRIRSYLREARRSAGLDCGTGRASAYPWVGPGRRCRWARDPA